jgi:hypothetical protein
MSALVQHNTPNDTERPPALPFDLRRVKRPSYSWVEGLPRVVRQALQDAANPAPAWPFAPRVAGAIARPVSTDNGPIEA